MPISPVDLLVYNSYLRVLKWRSWLSSSQLGRGKEYFCYYSEQFEMFVKRILDGLTVIMAKQVYHWSMHNTIGPFNFESVQPFTFRCFCWGSAWHLCDRQSKRKQHKLWYVSLTRQWHVHSEYEHLSEFPTAKFNHLTTRTFTTTKDLQTQATTRSFANGQYLHSEMSDASQRLFQDLCHWCLPLQVSFNDLEDEIFSTHCQPRVFLSK